MTKRQYFTGGFDRRDLSKCDCAALTTHPAGGESYDKNVSVVPVDGLRIERKLMFTEDEINEFHKTEQSLQIESVISTLRFSA